MSEESFPLLLHIESPPLALIVTSLDVVKDVCPSLGTGAVLTSVHAFPFEHPEEALGGSIVRAAPYRTHAAGDVVAAILEAAVARTG